MSANRSKSATSRRPTAAIVLAAGLGTRMHSKLPKVLHPLAGRPMIRHLLDSVAAIRPERVVVVVSPGEQGSQVAEAVYPHVTAVQDKALGTGHAVLAAKRALGGFDGDVLILFGGDPLIGPDTLRGLIRARRAASDPAVVVLGVQQGADSAFGRLVLGADGRLERIVEYRDASAAERRIGLCNAGVMAVDGKRLWKLLSAVGNKNAKGEYYLTDIVRIARAKGWTCAVAEGDADELIGVDTRADLARAEHRVQQMLRARALAAGAGLVAPETVHLSFDTVLAPDCLIEPYVVFGPGVTVEAGARVRSFSHLEGVVVGVGAHVGPFARLRPGARIGTDAHVGNFVEIKNATLEPGAKANHLSYIGDATVGSRANVGAGTITCNYDGFAKHRTEIGPDAFIGSNTALVAPVRVGARAIVGAGSVITRDVAEGALAVARGRQQDLADGGDRFRQSRQRAKTAGKTSTKGNKPKANGKTAAKAATEAKDPSTRRVRRTRVAGPNT